LIKWLCEIKKGWEWKHGTSDGEKLKIMEFVGSEKCIAFIAGIHLA